MDQIDPISRAEQKRRVKGLEGLAEALVALPVSQIKRLPCDEPLKEEIQNTGPMQAGARRRQIKYIVKQLRTADIEPLFTFLETEKGSKLKQDKDLHELERLRDAIISEAIAATTQTGFTREPLDPDWEGEAIAAAARKLPALDQAAAKNAALRYAKTRKPTYNREVFRLLKAATLAPGANLG